MISLSSVVFAIAASSTFDELERKQAKLRRVSQRILARHQAQDSLNEDEITHDLKQQVKLDEVLDTH